MGSGPDKRGRNAEAAALIEILMLRMTDRAEIPRPAGEGAGLRDDAGWEAGVIPSGAAVQAQRGIPQFPKPSFHSSPTNLRQAHYEHRIRDSAR